LLLRVGNPVARHMSPTAGRPKNRPSFSERKPSLTSLEPLFDKVRDGDAAAVDELLLSTHNIDVATTTGATLLHNAARNGHVDVVKKLISAGASPTREDYQGNTPLSNAIIEARMETVAILIMSGADLTQQSDATGYTPLHLAVSDVGKATEGERYTLVDALLTAGAPTHIADMEGRTPIDLARVCGRKQTLVRRLTNKSGRVVDGDAEKEHGNLAQATSSACVLL